MKKLMCLFVSLMLLFGSFGCSQRKAEPPQKEQSSKDNEQGKPDKKEGEKLLHNYARALILRDPKIDAYYTDNMKQHTSNYTPIANPHPNGYTIENVEEKEGKLEGKIKIFMAYTGEPYYSSDESKVTVVREKGMYLIDRIEKSKTTEVNEKGKILYMKEDGDIKGKEILRIEELPRFAVPQGSPPDKKYSIGNEKFGPVALDPEDKKLALSTYGQYPAVMVLDIKKKQIKALDIYFDGDVSSLAWSQDGKFLAVLMAGKQGSKFLRVYDIEKEKIIDDPMKETLKNEKFSVNNPYWISENELVFNISGFSALSPDEQKKTGSYKFDVKTVSLTRY